MDGTLALALFAIIIVFVFLSLEVRDWPHKKAAYDAFDLSKQKAEKQSNRKTESKPKYLLKVTAEDMAALRDKKKHTAPENISIADATENASGPIYDSYRKKWEKIAHCTKPGDKRAAEAGIVYTYQQAGLAPPSQIVWCASPRELSKVDYNHEDKTSQHISGQGELWELWNWSRDDFIAPMFSRKRGNQIYPYDPILEHRATLPAQVNRVLVSLIFSRINLYLDHFQCGQFSALEWFIHDFARQELGAVKQTNNFLGLFAIAKNAGPWIPTRDICYISEKMTVCKIDQDLRPHSEEGPAIQYSDGYSVFAWHGQEIPKEWVEGKPPSAAEAITWDNVEQRRIACEIIGWTEILNQLDVAVIDKDDDPQIGELVLVILPKVGTQSFLRVRCGTGRDFALPVPPEISTALEAQAWVNNVPEDVVKKLEVRT